MLYISTNFYGMKAFEGSGTYANFREIRGATEFTSWEPGILWGARIFSLSDRGGPRIFFTLGHGGDTFFHA